MGLIQAIFVLFLTYYFTLKIGKYFKINQIKITALFILKTIVCLTYLPIAKNLGNDAYGYFTNAFDNVENLTFFSTSLIFKITVFLRQYLFLNIYSVTFLFSFIGTIGSLALVSNIRTFTKNLRSPLKFLSELVIFFPTFNIWISAIGKDPITYACINLIIYALINIRSRIIILIVASLLFTFVRPFVGMILLFSLIISITIKAKLSIFNKFFIGFLSFLGLVGGKVYIKDRYEFLDLFNFEYSFLIDRIDYYSDKTATGTYAINLSEMPFASKVFSFMFRPLFLDAKDTFSLLMSFENLIILIIFLYIIASIFKNLIFVVSNLKTKFFNFSLHTNFLSIYLTLSWLLYSLTVGNLGTANRYKIMFLPALISLSLIFNNGSKLSVPQKYLK